MVAGLNDAPLVDNQDLIGVTNGIEPVGNDQQGLAPAQLGDGLLDVENETKVQQALSRLLAGKTVLVIAHRMRTVEAADKIVVLHGGRVVEEGTPARLMAKGGLYRRMVDLQRQSAGWQLGKKEQA